MERPAFIGKLISLVHRPVVHRPELSRLQPEEIERMNERYRREATRDLRESRIRPSGS